MRESRFYLTVATLVQIAIQHPEPFRCGGKRPSSDAFAAEYFAHLLKPLKDEGIVLVKLGAGGGYTLARPAERVTLGQIRMACGFIPEEGLCGLEKLVAHTVCDAVARVMNETTLADLARQAKACGIVALKKRAE